MPFNRIRNLMMCLGWIGLMASAVCQASGEYVPHWPRSCPFQFVASPADLNQVMGCPAHAHGTLEEAAEKLKNLVAQLPEGQQSGVWVCRSNQLHTLEVIGPLADNMLLNTMAFTSNVPPEPNDLIWPGFDHPFVNHIRLLRKVPNTRNLYAVIPPAGTFNSHFEKRRPSFEEIKWLTYAVIGSDFQGIHWRDGRGASKFPNQIRQMEEQILAYKEDLGKAVPVGWVTDSKSVPISARASDERLFVTALNPDYFQISQKTGQVALPISMDPLAGQLEIRLPEGVTVGGGQTISGRALNLQFAGGCVYGDYSFYGGGEMMVLELRRENQ